MDKYRIDVSVVLPLDGLFFDDRTTNDEVAQWCADSDGRLVPFCTVNPREPDAADEITRCRTELRARGVKFHPWLQGFHPNEPCLVPVCETAAELDMPMLFHDGTPPYSTPLQIAALAARFPDLQVVLGHGGLYDLWPEAVAAARRYPNVHLCMTSLHPFAMQRIIDHVPTSQLMFGSDGGLASTDRHAYVEDRWRMLRELGLDDAGLDAICARNPLALLERTTS
jgi:predicted TIM-barrel fold metal-dependent hydrolase